MSEATNAKTTQKTVKYDSVEDLLNEWQSAFERMMDGRWPNDEVELEWETTDEEAVLRLEEPPESAVYVKRRGSLRKGRTINVYFDAAVDAAQDIHRLIISQENPMGEGDRKHSAMLAIPLRDNFDDY